MLSVPTARRLRDVGVRWTPAEGDRFVVPLHDPDEVFVLSTMVVEVVRRPSGDVIGFNGTTEWALDSIEQSEAVWLPRESQLRDLLGGTFRVLRVVPDGWQVELEVNGVASTVLHADPEEAYGFALLRLVEGEREQV
ncbi:MAG: pilus assembly protein CpaE [Nakamurella sp.]